MGEWIPEPLPERTGSVGVPADTATADPADRVTLDESAGMAFPGALESMTPAQCGALILHDVFHYSFTEIAEITERTPPACRQPASSARRRVRALRPLEVPAAQQAVLVRNFRRVWEAQDIGTLIGLLGPDATFTTDGGGLAEAALQPVEGGVRIAHHLAALAGRTPADLVILERTVKGRPGLMARWEGATVAVYAFDVVDDRIKSIWAVRNPEKLRPWTGVGGEGTGAG
ncbi:RNA polymerase subunit sigma-24 [Streptomyces sp. CMSTAAHL-2]|uniref:RNA polymerase subunit sigma-24 n=1 Tax=Streptomyces sp. CMSTAAHL-2 TaxID=2904522 RepID=UPI0027E4C0CA|nr:RNA polymerase subunit sigma-24 [Streptomyces sp. CMSTAAHL-2]